jgi:hypothetical protein
MNASVGQELLIQLETALHRLVESFWDEPYRFFTEADAVVGLQSWVAKRPELAQTLRTADDFETSLLHCEYPTFFRFQQSDPTRRRDPPAWRGHYDLVLLDPAYIQHHNAETVTNRSIADRGSLDTPPLLAAVEFKLFTGGWNKTRVHSVKQTLAKLRLALEPSAHASAAYLCVLKRAVRTREYLWKRGWPDVKAMLAEYADIRAVVAVWWPEQGRGPFVHYSGPWITTATE